jgi:putative membrane protein
MANPSNPEIKIPKEDSGAQPEAGEVSDLVNKTAGTGEAGRKEAPGKILVLCVDRDNDFGIKAHVKSPIIGRKANVRAAVKLALADPEDSDSNSLFAAIKVYDELDREGKEVEIATVCGDRDVGQKSDHLIAYQLGEIISKVQPGSAILVSDGPEDEFVLPVLRSKLRVRGVRRVVVKQSERIESLIYIIRKGMAKEQIQKGIIVPISLMLMTWGIFAMTGIAPKNLGAGAIALMVGTYFLLQALRIKERATETFKEVRAGMLAAKLSIFTSLISFLFIFVGAAYTYQLSLKTAFATVEEASLAFGSGFLPWTIPAILVRWGGDFADFYLRHKKLVWSHLYMMMSGVAMVLLLSAVFVLLRYFLGFMSGTTTDEVIRIVSLYMLATVTIAVTGAIMYRYLRERQAAKAPAGDQ